MSIPVLTTVSTPNPDAWLTVPEATLSDLVFAGAALHDAVERADAEVAGDTARLAALLRCFPAAVRYPAPQDPGPPDPVSPGPVQPGPGSPDAELADPAVPEHPRRLHDRRGRNAR